MGAVLAVLLALPVAVLAARYRNRRVSMVETAAYSGHALPGVVVGAIFVSVMVLGEFATAAALSGRKVNLLGNIIVTQVGSLKWALASVVGVILTIVMGLVIAGFLRIVDLKREL